MIFPSIGGAFRKARRERGFTQSYLAQSCGIASGTVKLVERGGGMSGQALRMAAGLDRHLVVRTAPRTAPHEAMSLLRARRELSQRDVAALAGISRNTLARLEAGHDVGLPALCAVGKVLGAGLSLLDGTTFYATTAQGSAFHGWHTPRALFDRVEAVLGPFDLDPCAPAGGGSPVRARVRFTESDDGLELEWFGRVFMNPPYGRSLSHWVCKAREEASRGALVVGLLPARTDTAWWHTHVAGSAHIVFVRGRPAFGDQKTSAPFPSALAVWGAESGLLQDIRAAFPESFITEAPPTSRIS
jgi:site-specific DNA-methyltransferase (adenine-specific)